MNAKGVRKFIKDVMQNSYLFCHSEARITIKNIFFLDFKKQKKKKQILIFIFLKHFSQIFNVYITLYAFRCINVANKTCFKSVCIADFDTIKDCFFFAELVKECNDNAHNTLGKFVIVNLQQFLSICTLLIIKI